MPYGLLVVWCQISRSGVCVDSRRLTIGPVGIGCGADLRGFFGPALHLTLTCRQCHTLAVCRGDNSLDEEVPGFIVGHGRFLVGHSVRSAIAITRRLAPSPRRRSAVARR
jgi:hypothetical protein